MQPGWLIGRVGRWIRAGHACEVGQKQVCIAATCLFNVMGSLAVYDWPQEVRDPFFLILGEFVFLPCSRWFVGFFDATWLADWESWQMA